jgi:hypothetical protein
LGSPVRRCTAIHLQFQVLRQELISKSCWANYGTWGIQLLLHHHIIIASPTFQLLKKSVATSLLSFLAFSFAAYLAIALRRL